MVNFTVSEKLYMCLFFFVLPLQPTYFEVFFSSNGMLMIVYRSFHGEAFRHFYIFDQKIVSLTKFN